MTFLHPGLLWALPAVAIPILIHLLRRRRLPERDFAAMDFLALAFQKARRRILLEDALLLALRTGAVLFLILALAGPRSGGGETSSGGGPQADVIVLDASMSMGFRDGNGLRAWDAALAEAGKRLAGRLESQGDRAVLVRAGHENVRLVAGSPRVARQILEEASDPDPTSCGMGDALFLAAREAEAIARPGLPVRITILTDLQRATWDIQGREGEALRQLLESFPLVDVVNVGAPSRPNLAIVHLETTPVSPAPGEPAQIRTRVRNFGDSPRTANLEMTLDGAPLARWDRVLDPGEEATWLQIVIPAGTGPRKLEARLQPDGLRADDSRGAVVVVRETPTVILAGEPSLPGERRLVFETLSGFLALGPGAPLDMHEVSPSSIEARTLEGASVLVLADPRALPPSSVAAIADRVRQGMGLLWAVGPTTHPEDAAPLLSALGAGPSLVGPVRSPERPATLSIRDENHPAIALFSDPTWRPLLEEVPHSSFRILDPDAAPSSAKVPLVFDGESAAWIEWKEGEGRCAVVAAVPIPGWNRMEEIPGGTLPFLLEAVTSLVAGIPHPLVVETGEEIAVVLAAGRGNIEVQPPLGPRRIPFAVTARPEGGALVIAASPALVPGIWVVTSDSDPLGASTLSSTASVAVVPPSSESDLAAWDTSDLVTAVPDLALDSRAPAQGETPGKDLPLGDSVFLLVAGLLATESLLARWLDRKRASA